MVAVDNSSSSSSSRDTTTPAPTLAPTRSTQDWLMKGLTVYLNTMYDGSISMDTQTILDGSNYYGNRITLIEHYIGYCPRTETQESTYSVSKRSTATPTATLSHVPTDSRSAENTRLVTDSRTLRLTQTRSLIPAITHTVATASVSLFTERLTFSASASSTVPCNESVVIENGIIWKEQVISQQLNVESSWWQRVKESNVIKGLLFRFNSSISMPPKPQDGADADAYQPETVRTRAIMYKAAATPRERAINFHGIRGASAPSYPYAIATVTNGHEVQLEMLPLPKFEIYADEWWDIYLPASFVASGPCATRLLDNPEYTKMWGAISPGDDVVIVADDGLNPKENVYVYLTTIVIEPDITKTLADVAEGLAAAANALSIAIGALSSTVIASAPADVQAVAIFTRLEACNSPQVTAFFGTPWVLSPVYLKSVFGDEEKDMMLSIIVGNFALIVLVLIIQLIVACCIRMCCAPTSESEMSVFGLARFPSLTLSVMFGFHGGSLFAAARIIRIFSAAGATFEVQYMIPAIIVVAIGLVLPIVLYVSAWWCIPRTFQVYDLEHRHIRKAMTSRTWLKNLLPVGAIFPQSTRQSAGVFISSFKRSSHFWVTSPLWVSTVSGIAGFADLRDVDSSYGPCFTWGIIMGVAFLVMAGLYAWRMPKRHLVLTIMDVSALLCLTFLYGVTIPWRQILWPPNERFSQGEAGKINWPDLFVVIFSFIIIGLVALRAIFALLVCVAEAKVQSLDPPTYILWSHKSGGQLRAERLANINRINTDKMVLEEMFIQASSHEPPLSILQTHPAPTSGGNKNANPSSTNPPPLPKKGRILVIGDSDNDDEHGNGRHFDANVGIVFDEAAFAVIDDAFVDDIFNEPEELYSPVEMLELEPNPNPHLRAVTFADDDDPPMRTYDDTLGSRRPMEDDNEL